MWNTACIVLENIENAIKQAWWPPGSWELGHWQYTSTSSQQKTLCVPECDLELRSRDAQGTDCATAVHLASFFSRCFLNSFPHPFIHLSIYPLNNWGIGIHMVPLAVIGVTDAQRDFKLFPLSRHIFFEVGLLWLPCIGHWNMTKVDKCDCWTK